MPVINQPHAEYILTNIRKNNTNNTNINIGFLTDNILNYKLGR